MRLVQGPGVRLHVLLEVVVELEAALALVAAKHVVHLGDLHLHHLHVLQHFGGRHRLLLVGHLLGSHKETEGTLRVWLRCSFPRTIEPVREPLSCSELQCLC